MYVNTCCGNNNNFLKKLFFSGNIGHENVFYDILERKNAFLGYKKKEVQKVKQLTFFQ